MRYHSELSIIVTNNYILTTIKQEHANGSAIKRNA
jgi:hypothetical protein